MYRKDGASSCYWHQNLPELRRNGPPRSKLPCPKAAWNERLQNLRRNWSHCSQLLQKSERGYRWQQNTTRSRRWITQLRKESPMLQLWQAWSHFCRMHCTPRKHSMLCVWTRRTQGYWVPHKAVEKGSGLRGAPPPTCCQPSRGAWNECVRLYRFLVRPSKMVLHTSTGRTARLRELLTWILINDKMITIASSSMITRSPIYATSHNYTNTHHIRHNIYNKYIFNKKKLENKDQQSTPHIKLTLETSALDWLHPQPQQLVHLSGMILVSRRSEIGRNEPSQPPSRPRHTKH